MSKKATGGVGVDHEVVGSLRGLVPLTFSPDSPSYKETAETTSLDSY